MSTVLVISFTDMASDPRVDRQIRALRRAYDVIGAGTGAPAYPDVAFIDITPPPRRAPGRALGLARLLARRYDDVYWRHPTYRRASERLSHQRADVVIANDLDSLPLALSLGPPVVFDAHEYTPEEFGERRAWRILIRPYLLDQCRRYIPRTAAMTTVGSALADAYEREAGVRPEVLTNAPYYARIEPTDVHDPVRIIHHGRAIRGRGLEEMLRLGDLLGDRFVLDFVLAEGTPGFRETLIRRAMHNSRIQFPPPRPMRTIVEMANDYDIGLFILPPLTAQQLYALPNKFFEFIQARLAVAIGPSPEMAALIRRYRCGVVAAEYTAESVAKMLLSLDRAAIANFKLASHAAASELCAERNEGLLLSAVERALHAATPPAVAGGP